MIIVKQTIGVGKRAHDVYDLCNSIADTATAKETIKNADAPTDQSRCTRTAE